MGKKEKIVKMAQLEKTNKAKKELKMAKISKKTSQKTNAGENIWKTYTRIRTKKEQILLLQQKKL